MQFENLKVHDPFAEADNVGSDVTGKGSFVHIRIQQRSGRKTLTTVQVRSLAPAIGHTSFFFGDAVPSQLETPRKGQPGWLCSHLHGTRVGWPEEARVERWKLEQ